MSLFHSSVYLQHPGWWLPIGSTQQTVGEYRNAQVNKWIISPQGLCISAPACYFPRPQRDFEVPRSLFTQMIHHLCPHCSDDLKLHSPHLTSNTKAHSLSWCDYQLFLFLFFRMPRDTNGLCLLPHNLNGHDRIQTSVILVIFPVGDK